MAYPFIANSAGIDATAMCTRLWAAVGHLAVDGDHLVKFERKVGTVGTLYGEIADERWSVLHDLNIARHEKVHDDVDVRPAVAGGHSTHELKAAHIVLLIVALPLKGLDELGVFTIT